MATQIRAIDEYAQWMLSTIQTGTWPERYRIIDSLADLYRQQRQREPMHHTFVERMLYGWLTDGGQSAPVHQTVLLTSARFEQIDRRQNGANAFDALGGIQPAPDVPAAWRMRLRDSTYGPIVTHLLSMAVTLYNRDAALMDHVLDRWQSHPDAEVQKIAGHLRRALAWVRSGRRTRNTMGAAAGVLFFGATLVVVLFIVALLILWGVNFYEDTLANFFRQYLF